MIPGSRSLLANPGGISGPRARSIRFFVFVDPAEISPAITRPA